MTTDPASLAAALADIDRFTEQHMPPWSVIVAAARRSLRLSKIPCENCQGDPHKIDRWTCPSCGGSGEVYSKALIEAVENASKGLYVGEASDILDAILVYMGTE